MHYFVYSTLYFFQEQKLCWKRVTFDFLFTCIKNNFLMKLHKLEEFAEKAHRPLAPSPPHSIRFFEFNFLLGKLIWTHPNTFIYVIACFLLFLELIPSLYTLKSSQNISLKTSIKSLQFLRDLASLFEDKANKKGLSSSSSHLLQVLSSKRYVIFFIHGFFRPWSP